MANVISDETMEYVGILAKLELSDAEKEAAKKVADTKEGRAYDEDRAYCDVCAGSGKNKRFFREIFCSKVQCHVS